MDAAGYRRRIGEYLMTHHSHLTPAQIIDHMQANPACAIGDFQNLLDELRLRQTELETCNRKLVESQRQAERCRDEYAALYELAPAAYLVLDSRGIIIHANVAAAELIQCDRRQLAGAPLMQFVDPDQHVALFAHLRQCREQCGKFTQELSVRSTNGCLLPVQLATVCFRRGGGDDPFHYRCIMHDLTQQKAAEAHARKIHQDMERAVAESLSLKANAEAANRAKDDFLAILSHELRTPLTPVLMSAAAMETDPSITGTMHEEIGMIRRNVELEARLIDDLLDLTRITRGKLEIHPRVINAHEILQQTLGMLQQDAAAKKLRLETDCRAELCHVNADPARLHQAFWNIVKNAIKFTPEGGQIFITSANAGKRLRVQIKDTGIGIDPAVLDRIFNPFDQGEADVTRRFGGLGLGLTITRALMEAHGGVVTAASEGAGKGAAFTLEIDTVEPRPAVEAACAAECAPPAPAPPLRILLVEDNEATVKVMTRLLRLHGHDIRTANGVRAALEQAAEREFDLIICDLGLPDGSGLDLMPLLLAQNRVRKGIALSGYGRESDIQHSHQAGFIDHLIKPVNMDSLLQVIARVAAQA